MLCTSLRHAHIHEIYCFLSPAPPFRHGPPGSLLIPKCSKPQTKCTQKKTQKYANNPQKYAKTHKSKQFAISALFVLNNGHNSTQFLFWWAYQPRLSMHNTRNTGSKGSYYSLDLVIKVWSDWDSNLHACHNASIIATCVTLWYDMVWHF